MSVLIKGMEMPKHAGVNEDKDTVYRCIVIAHPDNSAELVIDTEFASPYDNGHNVKRCPLVEIPTPHGRLIDADFLIHMLNLALMPIRCSAGVDIDSMNEDQKIFVRTVINQIKSAPTVIEAEVSE